MVSLNKSLNILLPVILACFCVFQGSYVSCAAPSAFDETKTIGYNLENIEMENTRVEIDALVYNKSPKALTGISISLVTRLGYATYSDKSWTEQLTGSLKDKIINLKNKAWLSWWKKLPTGAAADFWALEIFWTQYKKITRKENIDNLPGSVTIPENERKPLVRLYKALGIKEKDMNELLKLEKPGQFSYVRIAVYTIIYSTIQNYNSNSYLQDNLPSYIMNIYNVIANTASSDENPENRDTKLLNFRQVVNIAIKDLLLLFPNVKLVFDLKNPVFMQKYFDYIYELKFPDNVPVKSLDFDMDTKTGFEASALPFLHRLYVFWLFYDIKGEHDPTKDDGKYETFLNAVSDPIFKQPITEATIYSYKLALKTFIEGHLKKEAHDCVKKFVNRSINAFLREWAKALTIKVLGDKYSYFKVVYRISKGNLRILPQVCTPQVIKLVPLEIDKADANPTTAAKNLNTALSAISKEIETFVKATTTTDQDTKNIASGKEKHGNFDQKKKDILYKYAQQIASTYAESESEKKRIAEGAYVVIDSLFGHLFDNDARAKVLSENISDAPIVTPEPPKTTVSVTGSSAGSGSAQSTTSTQSAAPAPETTGQSAPPPSDSKQQTADSSKDTSKKSSVLKWILGIILVIGLGVIVAVLVISFKKKPHDIESNIDAEN